MTVTGVVPHGGELCGRVFFKRIASIDFIACGGTPEKIIDFKSLERGRQEANRRGFAGSATDPVPHGEALNPTPGRSHLIEIAVLPRNGYCVVGER